MNFLAISGEVTWQLRPEISFWNHGYRDGGWTWGYHPSEYFCSCAYQPRRVWYLAGSKTGCHFSGDTEKS